MNAPEDPTFRTQTQPLEDPSDTARQVLSDSRSRATEPIASSAGLRDIRIKGYQITSEIARGGMGIVLAAREIELDREVAIKVMLDARRSSAAILRFVHESKITARLGHPGIPPVHAMGLLEDGSPYLAMKLVHGKTLGELLKERESPLSELSRFVQIFEQIAQAVGFAHSKGVIHRDLKPANIMVGEFGEVQVMDWGIAKLTNGSDTTNNDADTPQDDGQTQIGQVIGTPAYLPPEQARGEEVDSRADVFALGAILSVILTTKTPFADGTTSDEVIRLSASGDLTAAIARLDESASDQELIDLAKRCLSPNAIDRPPHGRAVADAVADYRAAVEQRLQEAEKRRAAAESKAVEQRKRRRVVMIAGALVCLTLAVGSMIAATQAIRASRAEAKTREQLQETDLARQEAVKAGEQAKERYQLALSAFDEMIFAIQNKLATRPGTLDIRKELLTGARGGLKKLLAEAEKQGNPDHLLINSYFQMGMIETTLGNHNDARREYETAHAMAQKLVEANPTDQIALADLSNALANLGDDAMARKQVDRAANFYRSKNEIDGRLINDDPSDLRWQRMLAQGLRRLGEVALYQNRIGEARQHYQQRLDLFRNIAKTYPKDLMIQRDIAMSHELMGDVCGFQRQPKEALEHYLLANTLLRKILESDPKDIGRQRDLSVSCTKLGNLHEDQNNLEKAVKFYEECTEIQLMIVATDPQHDKAKTDLFIAYTNLGNIETLREDYVKARDWFRKARDVIKPLHDQQKLVGQFANAFANSEGQIRGCDHYVKAMQDLDYVLKQNPLASRELLEFRIRLARRANDRSGMLASAEAFDKLIVSEPKIAIPAAIAWCQIGASEKDDAKFRDRCASKAIALLQASAAGQKPAFKPAMLLDGLQKDKSFTWLVNRDDGKAFLKTLAKP